VPGTMSLRHAPRSRSSRITSLTPAGLRTTRAPYEFDLLVSAAGSGSIRTVAARAWGLATRVLAADNHHAEFHLRAGLVPGGEAE
jgi:hypothetical protein